MYREKPDLYGPFWIYTTLIIMVAIAGNLSRYLQMGDQFTYNYNFVPIAATVIYSIGLGLPLALKLLMRFLGSNFFNGTFVEVRNEIILSFLYIDRGNIRLQLHIVPRDFPNMFSPRASTLMGFRDIQRSDKWRVPHGHFLEGPQLRSHQPRSQKETHYNRLHLCGSGNVFTDIQAILL